MLTTSEKLTVQKLIEKDKAAIKPGDRPHWSVLHAIFKGSGKATTKDVIDGYGVNFISVMAASILKNNILHADIDTPAKADIAAYRHLRDVIDNERSRHRAALKFQRKRSPDNGDYPRDFDTSRRDRENYDMIGR